MNLDILIEAVKFVEGRDERVTPSENNSLPRVKVEYGPPRAKTPIEVPELFFEKKEVVNPPTPPTPPLATPLARSPPLEKRAYNTAVWAKAVTELPYSKDHREEEFFEYRRRPGAGTREVHNKLEKNRRAHLKECFDLVKKQLPNQDDKKPSNLNILHNAIKYIQVLRRKDREHEHEMEKLAREKISLQQRFSSLKKELAAQWDHIDFNALLPEAPFSGDLENDEVLQRRSVGYSSTSSLSSAATASASPHLPSSVGSPHLIAPAASAANGGPSDSSSHLFSSSSAVQEHPVPGEESHARNRPSPKNIPSDAPKMISFTSRLEPAKRHLIKANAKASNTHFQLPVINNQGQGHISATLMPPTLQIVPSSNIRMMPSDQPLAFSISQPSTHNTGVVSVMHKPSESETLSVVHSNGVRGKGSILTIPNGTFHTKNGVIYKSSPPSGGSNLIPAHLPSGFTHVVTPIGSSHGTLVTPVPVTVVSQGNQVAHIISAPQGKVVTPVSIKPLISQYLVKPGAAMVVVSQSSTVTKATSK